MNRRIVDFCRRLPEGQVTRVRAEQVVSGDPATLARLARFAGVADDDDAVEAMRHPERSPYVTVHDAVALGGLDAKFLARPWLRTPALPPSLVPPPAGSWRRPSSPTSPSWLDRSATNELRLKGRSSWNHLYLAGHR